MTNIICHDELTISLHLSIYLAECDEEAGDLVNSLEDVVRDF